MATEQTLFLRSQKVLAERDIQTELYVGTAISAGNAACWFKDPAETEACCDALKHATNRHVQYDGTYDEYYCEYSDKGTGDWD